MCFSNINGKFFISLSHIISPRFQTNFYQEVKSKTIIVGGVIVETSSELAGLIEKLIEEKVDERIQVLEATYFAKAKQTLFTIKELADKWGCSAKTVATYLKQGKVEPVDKSGRHYLYDLVEAEKAKQNYTKKVLVDQKLNYRMRAM
ncbi:MerR family transcriptional regulator [Enterococcus faecium]|nr:MerR family transcriptional regulator [Enterococcus faecium]